MAVDVYGYIELFKENRWVFEGQMVSNPEREYDPDEPVLKPEELFHTDHKELAAILVEGNPIRAAEPYTTIVPRRGLPTDLSEVLATWLRPNEMEESFHTTWFTAAEALNFGWENRIMRRQAYVNPLAAPLFEGCPRGFPYDKWPAGLPISYAGWSQDGIEVEWLESYQEIVPEFTKGVLPKLARFECLDHARLIVVASW